MPHQEDCQKKVGNRENPKDILTTALTEQGKLTTIARGLQTREEHSFFCPGCQAEVVPKPGARRVPYRDPEGNEGFYNIRAHYSATGQPTTRRTRSLSLKEQAIDLLISHLEASQQHKEVLSKGKLEIEFHRREPTPKKRAGREIQAEYPVDILARKPGLDIIIQVEEQPLGQRYHGTAGYLTRTKRLAIEQLEDATKTTTRRFKTKEEQRTLQPRIHQLSILLRNPHYYPQTEQGIKLSPTQTLLIKGLYDEIYILDLEENEIIIPEFEYRPDHKGNIQAYVIKETKLSNFTVIEKPKPRRYQKRIVNRPGSRIIIPQLKIAKVTSVAYDENGQPFKEQPDGQLGFNI